MSTSTRVETTHVLVVDDSEISRIMTKNMLDNVDLPMEVTFVESAQAALEFLGQPNSGETNPRVDLIITNHDMPEMTGYDLTRKVKESSSLKHIKVVLMYDESDPDEISRWMMDGADSCMKKPMTPSSFYTTHWLL